MNSTRCDSCGLINFAAEEVCKRCRSPLGASGELPAWQSEPHRGEQRQGDFPSTQEYAVWPPPFYEGPTRTRGAGGRKGAAAIVLALLCMVALISLPLYLKYGRSEAAEAAWRDYRSDDDSFTILVPGEPRHLIDSRTVPVGTMKSKMSYVETGKGEIAYAFGYVEYPVVAKNVPVDALFDQAVESLSARTRVRILSRKEVALGQHRGIELEIMPPADVKKDGDRGTFRLYWVPPRVYMIMAGGPDSAAASADRAKFMDSFKLNKRPE